MKRLLIWIPAGIAFVLLVAFVIANRQPVVLSFAPFPWEKPLPLYVVFFLGVFAGLLLAALFGAARRISALAANARHRREVGALQDQLRALERQLDERDGGTGGAGGGAKSGVSGADRALAKH